VVGIFYEKTGAIARAQCKEDNTLKAKINMQKPDA